jgi:GDPmannose 4,6-dehydratase
LTDRPCAGVALVTGASGQDGTLLVRRLLADGWTVHACIRPGDATAPAGDPGQLIVHRLDLAESSRWAELVRDTRPDELYNLAGQSSVFSSFDDPLATWRLNAGAVAELLEALRRESPATRMYQASSADIFGFLPGASVIHDERSALFPQSPYAAAKAAAHVLCGVYRSSYGLRVACGILSNHESRLRPPSYLSAKVANHVRALRELPAAARREAPPLAMGNLRAQRDWGFAPDFVDGAMSVLRQVAVRNEHLGSADEDTGASYRDYVLGTGQMHSVWELVDTAFRIAGMPLRWSLEGDSPHAWHACFVEGGQRAVVVNPEFLRPSDPVAIGVDPSLANRELGWTPRRGLDHILADMLE